MAFGEFSPKWLCPIKRPRKQSPRNRTTGVWIVGVAFAVILMLVLLRGCPILQAT
jgi:hypothetical protein